MGGGGLYPHSGNVGHRLLEIWVPDIYFFLHKKRDEYINVTTIPTPSLRVDGFPALSHSTPPLLFRHCRAEPLPNNRLVNLLPSLPPSLSTALHNRPPLCPPSCQLCTQTTALLTAKCSPSLTLNLPTFQSPYPPPSLLSESPSTALSARFNILEACAEARRIGPSNSARRVSRLFNSLASPRQPH
jgi:hypothetical protein